MKLKGILIAIIISLASIMMPFSVYADGLIVVNGDDYLLGINVDLYDSSLETYVNQAFITSNNGTSNYSQYTQTNVINQVEIGTYKYTFVFNKSYVGRVVMQYVVPGSQTIRQFTLFVNGTTAEFYSSRDNRYTATSTFINNWTLSSVQLVEHDDIESLEQIVDLLTDIYTDTTDLVGASSDQLAELQNIVSNTSLANEYLNYISRLRQYNIPLESFSFVFQLKDYNLYDFQSYKYLDYPIFNNIPANSSIVNLYSPINRHFYLIMGVQSNPSAIDAINKFNDLFSYSNKFTINEFKFLDYYSVSGTFIYVDFLCNQGGFIELTNKRLINYLIPIYFSSNPKNVSTDFALQWGLSNKLLDDLNIIANGTTQSNSAASNLESDNSQMANDMNDLATIESGYNQQFNNQLQQIDFSSPLQSNAGILPAANFVITIFNGLINNNPFSVLIIIVCILLIGKKVIGK